MRGSPHHMHLHLMSSFAFAFAFASVARRSVDAVRRLLEVARMAVCTVSSRESPNAEHMAIRLRYARFHFACSARMRVGAAATKSASGTACLPLRTHRFLAVLDCSYRSTGRRCSNIACERRATTRSRCVPCTLGVADTPGSWPGCTLVTFSERR